MWYCVRKWATLIHELSVTRKNLYTANYIIPAPAGIFLIYYETFIPDGICASRCRNHRATLLWSFSLSNIISLPLAFVRSGYVDTKDGKARVLGGYLYSWSLAARLSSGAYGLAVAPTEVFPSSNSLNRLEGFPLRWHYISLLPCAARQRRGRP